jgi:hypothetical protein
MKNYHALYLLLVLLCAAPKHLFSQHLRTSNAGANTILGRAKASSEKTVTSAVKGTTSTTAVMMGLAGSITPTNSGTVLIIVSGTISNSKKATSSLVQLYIGTGSAPANATTLTGTAQGTQIRATVTTDSVQDVPFAVNAVVTGLTIGTTYWIDLALASSNTHVTASIKSLSISAIEQ